MKVFYRPEQVAFTPESPSAHKPKLVVEDWLADLLIDTEIMSFEPATRQQLELAHDANYVGGVLSGRYENGFGNSDMAVAATLPYTTGSMISGAEYAVRNREVVCSPVSGFHHSGHDYGAGYCSLNGLIIAAMTLKDRGLVKKVGIIDCDRHWGDGSAQIIQHLGLNWIVHRSQGKFFNTQRDCANGRFMKWLNKAINDCMGCDLILYQAGADPHINDPLGGLQTTEEMADRDRLVFQRLGHLPMAWCLAGGYQQVPGVSEAEKLEPILALHRQTARICSTLFPSCVIRSNVTGDSGNVTAASANVTKRIAAR